MSERRPPRREGQGRPQGPGSGPRSRKPGPGDSSRPPRREAQGASKPGSRPRPPRKQIGRSSDQPRPTRENASPDADRLQKVLAHAGIGSRRACEDVILQGRVTINGTIVRELGTKVTPGRDKIAVDGQPIHDERPAYIAVNKPKGYVSTNDDPSGRPRVVDLVPDIPQRVYTVGRLDEMSTGLMLLTNDGELANRLAHPKFGVEKVYRAVVAGTPPPEVYQKLVEGVWLAEGKVRAKRVRPVAHKGDATVVEMVLAEGKNREVRRMFAKLGHKVMTLTRVAVGPVTLKGLKPGGWRFLSAREVDLLRRVADGMQIPVGRFGNDDRPMRAPTRGPRAHQGTQPLHERREDRPPAPAARRPTRPAHGPGGQPPRPLPPRPPSGRPPRAGYVPTTRPPRPQQDHDQGPPPQRPQHGRPLRPQQGPQSGPPQRPQTGRPPRPQQGPPQRPRVYQGHDQDDAPPPPGPRPVNRRPQQARPPRTSTPPINDRPPTRRIIGLNLPTEPPPSARRPPPRGKPIGPPKRPLKRPGRGPKRRPTDDEE